MTFALTFFNNNVLVVLNDVLLCLQFVSLVVGKSGRFLKINKIYARRKNDRPP